MQIATIDAIFNIFKKNNPAPLTELIYTNNFTLLVAVVLSAQATDIAVNKATKQLFQECNSPQKMLALGLEGLKNHVKSIGLYNTKAKNIIALCHNLIEHYNGEIPKTFEQLVALPGVGRKTANVVLNCAFGVPTIAVDTHVFRVSKRLGLAQGSTPLKVETELLRNIPAKWLTFAHHWLILHGRYTCKAQKPLCQSCPINNYCEYYHNTQKAY